MKIETISFPSSEQQSRRQPHIDPEGRWLVICEAGDQVPGDATDPADIELLIQESVAEHLRSEERPLSGTILKEAIEEAHHRLRAACPAEVLPTIGALAIAEVKGDSPHYLVAGAGNLHLYGVSAEGVELAFRDPHEGRLGLHELPKINHQQFATDTYPSLVVLNRKAYGDLPEEELGKLRHIRRFCAATKSRAWTITSDRRIAAETKKRTATLALIGVAAVAIIGSAVLVKNFRHTSHEKTPRLAHELTAPPATLESPTFPVGPTASHDQLLTQLAQEEALVSDRLQVVEQLKESSPSPTPYDDQLIELSLMLEAELAAQKELLQQHKAEVEGLKRETAEHEKLRADFQTLTDMLAADTVRIGEMEGTLERRQEELIDSIETASAHEETIRSLEERLALLQVENEDLRVQQQELFHSQQALQLDLSDKQSTNEALVDQLRAFEDLVEGQESDLTDKLDLVSELRLELAEKGSTLAAQERVIEDLQNANQDHIAAIELLEDSSAALHEQVEQLSLLNQEQQLTLVAEIEQREGAEARLATADKGFEEVTQEKQYLESLLADYRTLEQEQQAKFEEVMTARHELSDKLIDMSLRNEALVADKENLLSKIVELENVQQLYEKERSLREDKEEMLANVATNLEGWKSAVAALEHSRSDLTRELAELRAYQESVADAWKEAEEQAATLPKPEAKRKTVTRIHLVSPGENLETIALRYYGTAAGQQAIVDANTETLTGGAARVGTALVIP